MYKFLKAGRVFISILVLVVVTLSFLYITKNIVTLFSPLLKYQFVPALLSLVSGSLLALILLLVLTLLFGRIYCSTLCPAGIFQDIVWSVSKRFKDKKKRKFKYSKPQNTLRYSVLLAAGVPFIFGITYPVLLLDPYSNYGRVVAQIFKSVETFINNELTTFFPDSISNKAFSGFALSSLIVAIVFLSTITILSAIRGRLYCNTICPVGSLLGLISKFSLFKPVINKSLCVNCGECVRACKSECINLKAKSIDESRCVTCFNCMTVCDYGALKYEGPGSRKSSDSVSETNKEKVMTGRREAIAAIGLLGISAAARSFNIGQTGKLKPSKYAITPPGSISVENLKDNCTSCNACIAACPNGIIKPASFQYGIDGFMLPVLSYENHFCGYECNTCSQVCPTGAILPVEIDKKRLIQIGVVNFTLEKCIVYKDGTDCGACDEHCPTKAITMVPYGSTGLFIPSTNTDICIGCGGCEYICPARPKAMIIISKDVHGVAKKPLEDKQKEVKVDEFGF